MGSEREIVREFEVGLPLEDAERWFRSSESRMCFPGAHEVASESAGLVLRYRVQLGAPGARRTADLMVEEHLTTPTVKDEGLTFSSTQVWRWPSGALASAWSTYELTPESQGRTRVRLSQQYHLPGTAMMEVLDDRRFQRSTEHAFDTYVAALAERATAPTT
jgi:hypothetical protein